MYDERADLDFHRSEVENLRDAMQRAGVADQGFEFAVDIGAGYGLHAPWLQQMAKRLYITDIVDYVYAFGPSTLTALADKFQRNDCALDRERIEYHMVDAHSLIYRDGLFDLCVSINAMEHIPDPAIAFAEMIRVTRPGGIIALQFDPLWNAPQGHHLAHLALEPWAHLMLPFSEFVDHLRKKGASQAEIDTLPSAMNLHPYAYYAKLFDGPLQDAFDLISIERWADAPEDEPATAHPNFEELVRRGFTPDELFVRGLRFIGRRRQYSSAAAADPTKPSKTDRHG